MDGQMFASVPLPEVQSLCACAGHGGHRYEEQVGTLGVKLPCQTVIQLRLDLELGYSGHCSEIARLWHWGRCVPSQRSERGDSPYNCRCDCSTHCQGRLSRTGGHWPSESGGGILGTGAWYRYLSKFGVFET